MLDLIAITYENIWPFKDQKLSLFFKKGNFLVKAPIGTGKSFLFFDGPSFALYKSSWRNILNIQSKTGTVKLLFKTEGQVYLIIRRLKQGKSKDSTSSQLFSCECTEIQLLEMLQTRVLIQKNLDIEDELRAHHIIPEEIVFKNETDLQQQLTSLLPPQEVFESTIFLLQDAENIFEMQPSQRLEVLKHVFWLLGIDESKEIVRERRTAVKYQIRSYQESTPYEQKFLSLLKGMLQHYKTLQTLPTAQPFLEEERKIFEELEIMGEKLSIQNFSLDSQLKSFVPRLQKAVTEKQAELSQKQAIFSVRSEQENKLKKQILTHQATITQNNDQISKLDKLLSEINIEEITSYKQQRENILLQQQKQEAIPELSLISSFYHEQKVYLGLQPRSDFSLWWSRNFIQELFQLGIHFKQEHELLLQKKEAEIQNQQRVRSQLQEQLKVLTEQELFYQGQVKSLAERLEQFDLQTNQDAKFDCWEIGKPCPFVRLINQQHFQQREKEKNQIIQEQEALSQKIAMLKLSEKKQELEQAIKASENTTSSQEIQKNLTDQMEINQNKRELLRKFLQSFDYKAFETTVGQRETLNASLKEIERKLQEKENSLAHRDQYQQEKIWLLTVNEQLMLQISSIEKEIVALSGELQTLKNALQEAPQSEWLEILQVLENYQSKYQQLEVLLWERNDLQVKIKALEQEEKLLWVLYTVLNRDLLLFVLSEYLPILSEIINSYLSTVVSYILNIRLKEESEKLELETKILDEKGEREVKSLSGGQRTILKLVRMLAISSYLKTEMLFLDETVNNLDVETVGKVAQLLDGFVKQRQMKFYVITHNTEIQWMSIWNQIIELDKIMAPALAPSDH